MGNKGATLIRFVYEDTSFCFANCHLESGQSLDLIKKRAQQINDIFNQAFIKERGTQQANYSVASHQVQVIFGDLNYRIDLENSAVKRLVKIHDLDELAKFDEFQHASLYCKDLSHFSEGPLTFDPTYKYNKGSDDYDDSSKQRTPAWCDRILFRSDNNLS